MSMTVVIVLTVVATAVAFGWTRLAGESIKTAALVGLVCGFVIPWGVASLLWVLFGGAA